MIPLAGALRTSEAWTIRPPLELPDPVRTWPAYRAAYLEERARLERRRR